MESTSVHDEKMRPQQPKERQRKPKDLLSLKSINAILTKTLNRRNAWVAQTEWETTICHLTHLENALEYMYCELLSVDLRDFARTASKQAKSDLCGHDLTLHYLSKKVYHQIDSVVSHHIDHIISEQSEHIQKAILLSINIFYCLLEQDLCLSTDDDYKYIGKPETRINFSELESEYGYNQKMCFDDALHIKAILCKELYKAFVKPLSTDARYQWLYELLNNFNYIKPEQSQISEQFLFDFLAIISILALDLSDCSKSTEPYISAVCSFLNVESDFIQENHDNSSDIPSMVVGKKGLHKPTNSMIGAKIKENQELEDLTNELESIIEKIKAMSSKFLAFVHKSDKILDMLKKEDEIIKLHQSLFEGNSIEGKRNVISSLQEYYLDLSTDLQLESTQFTQSRSN